MFGFKSKKSESKNNSDEFVLLSGLIKKILPDDIKNIELTPKTKFIDLGFDSMQFINLLLSLEDIIEKDLEEIVAEIDMASIDTIEDVINILESLKVN